MHPISMCVWGLMREETNSASRAGENVIRLRSMKLVEAMEGSLEDTISQDYILKMEL